MAETEIKNYNLNFGPQHPAAHGVLRMVLEMDGEVIDRADPHIGLLHRGTEKLIEHKTYVQAVPYFDRLDYVAPQNQEHAFVLAVEKLLGLEVPKRAQYLRVLFSEIGRELNHLLNVTSYAMDVGAMTPMLWGFEERERLMEFCERVSGARLHMAYYRPGGVAYDMPEGLAEDINDWAVHFVSVIDDLETLLTENRIFKQRTVDIGVITAEQCFDWGFTGPNLRASGVPWDLRKSQPYDAYAEMDFDLPIGKNGDCYDRYAIRLNEIRESMRIVEQILDKMPPGEYRIQDKKVTPPPRVRIDQSMEALIHHFKIFTEGFKVPEGEAYACVESPRGELGVYMVSDGTSTPYRMHVRGPSFINVQTMPHLMQNGLIADGVAIISSVDPIMGEVDR